MLEVICYDSYGNSIDKLVQWDVDQTLTVENWEYEATPVFHFCNKKHERALVVKGEIVNGCAKSNIPNSLLQEPYPIIVFVYLEEGDSGRSIYVTKIPVIKKAKPEDYEYQENIEYVSWVKLSEEAEALIAKLEQANFRKSDDGYIQFTLDGETWSNLVGLIDLKGDKGDNGVGVESIEQTITSTEDDGNNVFAVTLTDGTSTTFTVKNGSKGSTGDAGHTPVRGTDYYTEEDKTEIVALVLEALPLAEDDVY